MSQLYEDQVNPNLVNCHSPILEEDMTTHESKRGKHFFAGALAGAASRTISAPFDRIKVLLQVQGAQLVNVRLCFQHMLREGGYKSFWRGNGVNVMKIAPELAFKFMFYDEVCYYIAIGCLKVINLIINIIPFQIKLIIHGSTQREIGLKERIISGSMAGAISQTLIYPMEVLKTRLCLRKTGQYSGLFDAVTKIYRTEGLKAFYKGYFLNILGIIPYAGIDLAIYEVSTKISFFLSVITFNKSCFSFIPEKYEGFYCSHNFFSNLLHNCFIFYRL